MPKLTKGKLIERQEIINRAKALRKEGWGIIDTAKKVKKSVGWVWTHTK